MQSALGNLQVWKALYKKGDFNNYYYCIAGCSEEGVDFKQPVDVYAIGFEEMVDLNAGNIISTK